MSVYEEVIEVLSDYLGPAAKRYVDRQIDFHLEKKPEEITREDALHLAEWIRSSLGLLTKDHAMVDESAKRLAELGHGS